MSFAKTIPFLLITLLFIKCGKDDSSKNLLLAPNDDWRGEVIEFPLKFAPSLQYSGTEFIRFAPGWGKENAKDYFSYAFLWDIKDNPKLSAKKLESEMEIYFNGIMNMVSKSGEKIPESKAFFEKVNETTYAGKVLTYDAFITKRDLQLNLIVEQSFCKSRNKHFVLFLLSPQPTEHSIWKKMKKIDFDVQCN
ncbi:hypothetical protein [Aquimarina sp. 2201CG5-10]|uniref:hypothetical protein n=1 Tax=Aquimarina callyspongiae TaxID=3098150 RepID=UPI002AB5707E|nr:hypothetical protein [Aquimarina sp. 2201CG5-10]MDY8135805.1 hypothetical protein [Aquimarina sp. 2201CG5-10]